MADQTMQREHEECLAHCDSELAACLNETLDSPSDACNRLYRNCEKSCDGLFGEGQEI